MEIKPNYYLYLNVSRVLLKNPALWGLFIFAAWALTFYIKGNLTAPLDGDEGDYVQRGVLLANQGVAVIADGYRPPLFIFITAALSNFFNGESLLIATRLLNMAFVSIIPVTWLLAAKSTTTDRSSYILMAILTSVWAPFYYFASKALAESVSLLLLNALIILTLSFSNAAKQSINIIKSIACAIVVAMLFLSKANNILIAPACAIIAVFLIKSRTAEKFYLFVAAMAVSIALIFPWVNFLHNSIGEYKLTTSGGLNFLVGTGHYYFGMNDKLDKSVLPERYIDSKISFRQTSKGPSAISLEDEYLLNSAKSRSDIDTISKNIGIRIWKENAITQSVYGCWKVLHSLGGSMRGLTDYFLMLFLGLTIICSAYCFMNGINKQIVYLHWLFVFAGFCIAFVYLPNIRFKVFYFDSTGLLLLSTTICSIFDGRFQSRLHSLVGSK